MMLHRRRPMGMTLEDTDAVPALAAMHAGRFALKKRKREAKTKPADKT